jgi:hypothetical protein
VALPRPDWYRAGAGRGACNRELPRIPLPRTSVNRLSCYFAFIVVYRNPLHCEQQSVSEGGYEGSRSICRARVTSNGSMHLSFSSTGPYLHLHVSEWKKGK